MSANSAITALRSPSTTSAVGTGGHRKSRSVPRFQQQIERGSGEAPREREPFAQYQGENAPATGNL
jgi:hypothetical protein